MRLHLTLPIAAFLTACAACATVSAPLPASSRPDGKSGAVTILSGGDSVDVDVDLQPLGPLSPALRAILAYYAMRGTGGCPPGTWSADGKVYDMRCPFTTALGLGRQCSEEQFALVRAWFKDGLPRLGLSRTDAERAGKGGDFTWICQDTPYTATHQVIWENLGVSTDAKGLVTVTAKGSWLCGVDCGGGDFTYVTTYRILPDRVQVVRERERSRRDRRDP